MKYLFTIFLFCSCATTTKTYILDSSQSEGNLVKRDWRMNGVQYDTGITTTVTIKNSVIAELIVTDSLGRKDSTFKTIP